MSLPKIEGQNLKKPLGYDPKRKKFIRFDELVSGTEKIIPIEQLSPADLKTLVIERQRRGPDYTVQPMSGPPQTRDDVIRAIETGEKIGRMTLEAETSHLKDLLRQIQSHLDQHNAGKAGAGGG
jgi:hypothetical protein